MIDVKQIFARSNRGLLLDAAVFLFQLLLLRLLTTLSLNFFHFAQERVLAKTAIGVFLVALFVLQPLGPVLKRWSFHQHFPSFENDLGGLTSLFLSFYKFFYIAAMAIMIYLAYSYFHEASQFAREAPRISADSLEKIVVAGAIVLPLISGYLVFRYFRKPEKPPRWKFLMTPEADAIGDLCMFLNVICFQILFSVYFSSPHFWNAIHKTTRLASSNFDSLAGRIYLAGIAALLVYLPPRIFYLIPARTNQHRAVTWLFMLLANLPLILAIVFYEPVPRSPTPLRQASFTVTAVEMHDEYEKNYQAAMRKYLGQYVDITGHVQTRFFPRSLELNDEIGLDGKGGYPWAYCSFDEDQVETAEALAVGEEVTLQCVGADDWSRGPALKHCVVVK